jgi:hypothetical protein
MSESSRKSASITPASPGNAVYAFVPADVAGLQSFLNQYSSSTKEMDLYTRVQLRDVAGSATSTIIEVQETHGTSPSYVGAVGLSVGGIEEENQDF